MSFGWLKGEAVMGDWMLCRRGEGDDVVTAIWRGQGEVRGLGNGPTNPRRKAKIHLAGKKHARSLGAASQ